jgi:hypothetical protein
MAVRAAQACCCAAPRRARLSCRRVAAAAPQPRSAAAPPAALRRAALAAPLAARRYAIARRRHAAAVPRAALQPLAVGPAWRRIPPTAAAALCAFAAAGAACAARHAAPVLAVLDLRVLASSLAAVAKLAAICYVVRRLTRAGRLPAGLPPALAAVSFELLLPCFLFSRVAVTLAAAPPGAGLLALPLLAAAQVALGGALGAATWALADGSAAAALRRGLQTRWRRGAWHPTQRPARSAAAVATALALATGAPALAAAVAPPPPPEDGDSANQAPQAWRLVVASSAFGNSVTLPLLFLTQLLPAAEGARAAGLCALFMVGWSPLLWSVGWRLLAPPGCDERPAAAPGAPPPPSTAEPRARPPLMLPHPAPSGRRAQLITAGRIFARRVAERSEFITSAVSGALNPPLVGVLLGVFVGATPLSAVVLPGAALASGALRPPPLELALFAAAARCCADAAALLGDAALPVGTLVLATALSPPAKPASSNPLIENLDTSAGDAAASLLAGGARGAAVAALVRLLLLPAACVALGAAASQAGLLPADPALRLVLLAQSAMPSAQNLVLLLALRRGTAAAAPRFAAQLLRQYALAALPVAAWMSLFMRLVR